MKRMKKFASLLLALVMVLSLSTTVMAATITAPGETTGDQNAAAETYKAYKIFDVTTTADGKGYSYTLSADSAWISVLTAGTQTWFDLTMSADKTVYNVALKTGVENNDTTAKAVAQYLSDNIPKGVTGITISSNGTEVDNGYYLIESSVGANLVLATYNKDVNIEEKNTYPSLEKTADKTSASIGDTVTYTIKVNVPESADKEVVVHDKMIGLSFVKFVSVTNANNKEITYEENMSPKDGCTFELTFEAANVAGKTVTIKYEATLNENAVIKGEEGSNKNSAWLTYSEFTSTPSEPKVDTYKFQVVKTDNADKVLDGAKFELYTAATDAEGVKINLVKEAGGIYRVATAEESAEEGFTSAVIDAGTATIEGLGSGTYYLEETVAPAGYNKLTVRKDVVINDANNMATVTGTTYTAGGVQVVNQSGTELPSTGGMGTTIFYVIGSILVIGAAVLLVTKKRMSVER